MTVRVPPENWSKEANCMLFLVWLKVNQPERMSQKQIYQLWMRESEEAPKIVKREKVVTGPYKVAGRHEILTIANFESLQELDRAFSQLPLLRELGHSVKIEILPLYPIPDFMQHVEHALKEGTV
jgi:muconolactone delta-isomerase